MLEADFETIGVWIWVEQLILVEKPVLTGPAVMEGTSVEALKLAG
jgi:hypothetical protein